MDLNPQTLRALRAGSRGLPQTSWSSRSGRAHSLQSAALAAVTLLVVCGAPRYLMLEMAAPPLVAGAGAPGDALGVELRLGDTWIEVHVKNLGDTPASVSLDGVTFTTPEGVEHRMIESAEVQRLSTGAASADLAYRSAPMRATNAFAPTGYHSSPLGLVDDIGPRLLELAMGDSVQLVFFPVEHVRIEPSGFTSIMPLFCDGSAARAPHEVPFRVKVPLSSGGGWRTMVIAGRVVG